jgi:SAM-dependent methyltransferase
VEDVQGPLGRVRPIFEDEVQRADRLDKFREYIRKAAPDTRKPLAANDEERPVRPPPTMVLWRAMPFADEHFDLVVSNSTLEHIPGFWLAVAEMHRVLAPGGYLLVATPGYRRLRGESRL